MSRYRNVDDPEDYERAVRELTKVLDERPLLHYAVPVTEDQVARDNARERKRLGIEDGEGKPDE
ncbi:hypothetical protein [Streptomyces sp.]|uniref:hypothetical protein n=1 Tax=Streptomyces sp. TaxID=1931 RepID=UPI002F9349B9